MRTFDMTPLFRSTVGFDRLADMLDSVSQFDSGVGYPPYNIERTEENHYRISLAVAGFAEKDLTVETRDGVLSVIGKQEAREPQSPKASYLYQGIAGRTFDRRFQLAENVEVRGASLENGLLHIELERIVPEEKKPRRIAIGGRTEARSVLAPKAA